MGGSWRDDRAENIGAAHSLCNIEKGSRRFPKLELIKGNFNGGMA
jgi:hypothetical protein